MHNKSHALGVDKTERLQEVNRRDSSATSFMASVEECITERECTAKTVLLFQQSVVLWLYA